MGKALVIKNADFSENKVSTITFNTDIHCTGIEVTHDSISISELGAVEIPYTVVPSNTTDLILWQTSDSDVVEVNGSTLTAVGIGSCTVTVSCGSHSASCEVTVSVTEEPYVVRGYINIFPGLTTEATDRACELTCNTTTRMALAQLKAQTGLNTVQTASNSSHPFTLPEVTQIKIPKNAKAMQVYAENIYGSGEAFVLYFVDNTTYLTGIPNGSNTGSGYKYIDKASLAPSSSGPFSVSGTISIPEGATGFLVYMRPRNDTADLANATSEQDLVDYLNNYMKFSLQYLTEAANS